MSSNLKDYIAKLNAIADGSTVASVARDVAVAGLATIDEGFATETDPYGVRWQPLKAPVRTHGNGILDDTSAMRRAFFAYPQGTRILFRNTSVQACAQNYGYAPANLPSRMMLPSLARGLGAKWSAMVSRIATPALRLAATP